jgi:hypothetical protein
MSWCAGWPSERRMYWKSAFGYAATEAAPGWRVSSRHGSRGLREGYGRVTGREGYAGLPGLRDTHFVPAATGVTGHPLCSCSSTTPTRTARLRRLGRRRGWGARRQSMGSTSNSSKQNRGHVGHGPEQHGGEPERRQRQGGQLQGRAQGMVVAARRDGGATGRGAERLRPAPFRHDPEPAPARRLGLQRASRDAAPPCFRSLPPPPDPCHHTPRRRTGPSGRLGFPIRR